MKTLFALMLATHLLIVPCPAVASAAQGSPPILVGGAYESGIDIVGGVDARIYWKNNSAKDIKYITFTVEPYNAVGDRVASEIGGTVTMDLKITGPIPPYNMRNSFLAGYIKTDNPKASNSFTGWEMVCNRDFQDEFNRTSENVFGDPNTDKQFYYYGDVINRNYNGQVWTGAKYVYLENPQLEYVMGSDGWSKVWYNNTIRIIKITAVNVIWMDGTTAHYSGDTLSYICQTQPKPKDIQ